MNIPDISFSVKNQLLITYRNTRVLKSELNGILKYDSILEVIE